MNMKPSLHTSTLLFLSLLWLAAMGASGPQCAQSEDQLLVPSSTLGNGNGSSVSECVLACIAIARIDREEERARHRTAKEACGDDSACLDEEGNLHGSIMKAIARDQARCVNACHEQGGGSGGQ